MCRVVLLLAAMLTDRAEHLSPKRAASLVGRTAHCLWRWRSAGKGPPFYRMGGRIVYLKAEVVRWFQDQRVA